MRDFHELSWSEGTETVAALMKRLTVMRPILCSEPMKRLSELCENIVDGNIRAASESVCDLTGALLLGNYRRVTGELFEDFLLNELFLTDHPFARMAAENRLDEAMYNAMKEDLDVLFELRGLDGETLMRYVRERYRELKQKMHPSPDLAARRAQAAWGGGAVRPPEDAMPPLRKMPTFLPSGSPSWHYGEEELRDSYVSDEALEEMYHRFMEAENGWTRLNEDLWNFFASYGSGDFLRVRRFTWLNGKLSPAGGIRQFARKRILEDEYRECLDHFIAFMRGETSEPLLICGAEGMGKTTMLFSAADELPELRLVYVPEEIGPEGLLGLFEILRGQPLKFAVALDNSVSCDMPGLLVPENVLLVALSEKPQGSFAKKVMLPELRIDSFADVVMKLLDKRGSDLPRDVVRSACVDHQVDSKGELTVAAAIRVAESLCR